MTDNLRALALAATPGPWLKEGQTIYALMHFGWRKGVEQFKNRFWASVYKDSECPEEERQANVDFIAAANPAAVLALLDEIDRLKAEIADHERAYELLFKENAGLRKDAERLAFVEEWCEIYLNGHVIGSRHELDDHIDAAKGESHAD